MKTQKEWTIQDKWAEQFSRTLKPLDNSVFPMRCTACGMQFEDVRTFFAKTAAAFDNEGLTETYDGSGHHVLDVGRNCECGRLVVQRFKTRRDESKEGTTFRGVFSEKMDTMRAHGTGRREAHDTLLNLLYNRGKEAVMAL